MRKRYMIELAPEVNKIVSRLSRETGRTKKEIISIAVLRLEQWGEDIAALVYESAPPSMLRSEAFWNSVRSQLEAGVRRCEEKYREGKGGLVNKGD